MHTATCICNCSGLLMSLTCIDSTRVQLMRRTYHVIFITRLSARIRSPSSLYRCLCVGCLVCSLTITCSISIFCLMRFQLVLLLAYTSLLQPVAATFPTTLSTSAAYSCCTGDSAANLAVASSVFMSGSFEGMADQASSVLSLGPFTPTMS